MLSINCVRGPISFHIKFSYWKLQITNFTFYEPYFHGFRLQEQERISNTYNNQDCEGMFINCVTLFSELVFQVSLHHFVLTGATAGNNGVKVKKLILSKIIHICLKAGANRRPLFWILKLCVDLAELITYAATLKLYLQKWPSGHPVTIASYTRMVQCSEL